MGHFFELVATAPPERIAVLVCLFFLSLESTVVGVLWRKLSTASKENELLHELQRDLLREALWALRRKEEKG